MSVPSGQVQCNGCDYHGVMQHRAITLRYELPDGETVDAERSFGWCKSCNGIRDIEVELDAQAIRQQLNSMHSKRRSSAGFFVNAVDCLLGGKPDDDKPEFLKLTNLLHLAEIRRSPPRCLICSGASVLQIDFDEEGTSSNFVHSCGSRLYQVPSDPDAPRFFYREEVWGLDVEGNRLCRRQASLI